MSYSLNSVGAMNLSALSGDLSLQASGGNHLALKSDPAFSGSTSASNWRSGLGVAINTDVQAHSSQLDTLAGLAVTNNNMVLANGSAFTSAAPSAVRTALSLVPGTDVQAQNARLADVAGLSAGSGNFIVGNGSNFVAQSGSTARSSLGVAIGSAVQAYSANLDDVAAIDRSNNNYVLVTDGSNIVSVSGSTFISNEGVQANAAVLDDISTLGEPSGADKVMYSTASNAFGYADLTSYGRSIIADADAGAALSTLGIADKSQSIGVDALSANKVSVGSQAVGGQSELMLYAQTTDATDTIMTIDNAAVAVDYSNCLVQGEDCSIIYEFRVSGRRNDVAGDKYLVKEFKVLCKRLTGGDITEVSTENAVEVFRDSGISGVDVTLNANTTGQCLDVHVVGESAHNWSFVASAKRLQVN